MIKIGTDIIEISRIKIFVDKNIKNLTRIFTDLEIKFSLLCLIKSNKSKYKNYFLLEIF